MNIRNSHKRRQGGMAVIVMLALLSIMLLYITASIRSLYSLERELKLLEQHQTRRLAALNATSHLATTNTPPAVLPAPSQTVHE
jgi:hypothetical protein